MDIKAVQKQILVFLRKYRYAVLALVLGVGLLFLPARSRSGNPEVEANQQSSVSTETVEERLSAVLSQIDGAGKVEVMLTVAVGEETVFQYDEDTSATDTGSTVRRNVVTVTDSQRNQTGLVRQVNPPAYLGAIVVCEGADNPVIQLAITDAVSKLTGLGSNRISVLKMK